MSSLNRMSIMAATMALTASATMATVVETEGEPIRPVRRVLIDSEVPQRRRKAVLVAKREYTSRTKYRPHQGAKERAKAAKRSGLVSA